MVISGIFGILAFIASIILAVQNKGNRNDHEYDGRYRGGTYDPYWGPSYCNVWNCDTIIAGNVGYSCFSLIHHAYVNKISVSKRNILMSTIVKVFALRVKSVSTPKRAEVLHKQKSNACSDFKNFYMIVSADIINFA